jgi:hypothetical protein
MRGLMNPIANKSAGWSHDISSALPSLQSEGKLIVFPPSRRSVVGIYLVDIGITLRISIYVHSLLSDASARGIGP